MTTLVDRLLAPFRRFAAVSSAGGIVLIAATFAALFLANSPWASFYHHMWEVPLMIGVGSWAGQLSAHHVINDGLMAIFFFVVGLEIKRELVAGELKNPRTAALPLVAALGGMIVPAAIFASMNHAGAGADGWGIPMATDIAFALGILSLLGDRVPTSLKVFVAAFAIADDIGAILVIAVFYSSGVNYTALIVGAIILATAAGANFAGVRSTLAFAVLGLLLWVETFSSGIHATVAGVLLAMTIPVRTRIAEDTFLRKARRALDDFHAAAIVTADDPDTTVLSNQDHHAALEELETLVDDARPPLIRLEHALHGIVSFIILPLFAFANAGVSLNGGMISEAVTNPVLIGAFAGLTLGKPIGIALFSWLAVKLRWATLPSGVTWPSLWGAGILGGIGFTMALFVADLAYADALLLDTAKLGVLAASLVTGIVGWLWLRASNQRLDGETLDHNGE